MSKAGRGRVEFASRLQSPDNILTREVKPDVSGPSICTEYEDIQTQMNSIIGVGNKERKVQDSEDCNHRPIFH